jgi:protein SCO1
VSRAQALRALWIAIACGLVLVAAGIYVRARAQVAAQPESTETFLGTPLTPPKFAADAVLTDQNGRPAHLYDSAAASTFLFFGYTQCPDECPLALAALGKAYRSLTPAQAARTRIVFVTVDPKRDVPRVMKRYVTAFDARILGLTGTRAQLAPVWSAYGVSIDATTKELAHGDAIYAIDRTQHVVLIYPPATKASDLASDAASLGR